MNNKILEKIKKLFALGADNINKHESESAMKMARKLLDKHNLSVYDLKEKDDVSVKIEDNVNMPWIRIIYGSIARLYDTEYILDKNSKPAQHLLIGTESNRVTASIVIDFVINEIRDCSIGMGNGYRNSAAFAIKDKVDKIVAERNASKEEVIPGTGLIPMKVYLQNNLKNQEWIKNQLGHYKQTKSSVSSNPLGRKLGEEINLAPQLSNKYALN